jgi:hypothetical protein
MHSDFHGLSNIMNAKRSDSVSCVEPQSSSSFMTQLLTRSQLRILKLTALTSLLLCLYYTMIFTHPAEHISYPHIFTNNRSATTNNTIHTLPRSTIGKVTASFGSPDTPYELAMSSHNAHNTLHNYPSFVLREQMLSGLWSKHAYILTVLGNELSKPSNERLQWLFWSDRDTVLMNPNIPLEVFLPPQGFGHINLLVTRDRNGLNNGVFFLRVHQSSFKLFASALSIREYLPELELKYTEQSAMEEVIRRVCTLSTSSTLFSCILQLQLTNSSCPTVMVVPINRLRPSTLVQRLSPKLQIHSIFGLGAARLVTDSLCQQSRRLEARAYSALEGSSQEEGQELVQAV